MKYAGFKYSRSTNLGDEIQSLAAEQFLPGVDTRLDRDELAFVPSDADCILIMNGWFSHTPASCFVPSKSIRPVFISFHMTHWNDTVETFLSQDGVEYFKEHQPIGCRDRETARRLSEKGVEAFCSGCLTVTFPRRVSEPTDGRVFLVDAEDVPVPLDLQNNAIVVTHEIRSGCSDDEKMRAAADLLRTYREQASLVVTTKVHCAIPCAAMGIPVVFFGNPANHRVSVVGDLGLPINALPRPLQKRNTFWRRLRPLLFSTRLRKLVVWLFLRNVNWSPPPLDVEAKKEELISILREKMQRVIDDQKRRLPVKNSWSEPPEIDRP